MHISFSTSKLNFQTSKQLLLDFYPVLCYNANCGLVRILYSNLLRGKNMNSARFSFPAVKGIQANMEYYVAMVPLDCIPKLFTFTDENLPPEIRSQRTLNKARIPEMCDYILTNLSSYVFSALTASIDGDISFEPTDANSYLGMLSVSMSAKMLINDGQHRRAAIEAALKRNRN